MSARKPSSQYVPVQGREVHFTQWGPKDAPALLMWHGLARTGRDFDTIAEALSDRFHVICPDTIGRGLSQWSVEPERDYCLDVYAEQAAGLADALGFDTLHWVGTSMGGALGIRVAATTLKGRIERLLINDIGPTFPEGPFERIKQYVGDPPEFSTMRELEDYFRTIYEPFGFHTDPQWRHLTETSSRRLPSGKVTTHYDPAIVRQMFVHPNDYEQWEHYDGIEAETCVLHGVNSDLLLPEIAHEMTTRGPRAQVVEIEGCGHAPGLVQHPHIEAVRDFLAAGA